MSYRGNMVDSQGITSEDSEVNLFLEDPGPKFYFETHTSALSMASVGHLE